MRIFDNYLNSLDDVLSKKVTITPALLKEQRSFNSRDLVKSELSMRTSNFDGASSLATSKVLFNYDQSFVTKFFGKNDHCFDCATIGPHPDFKDLKDTDYINHHCVSVFIDIKGSTRLIEKYTLLEVRLIKDSLLTLAIHVVNQFGGHVHRLQGDGIFVQFVRKDKCENDALINALNATSLLTQFVSVDLAKILKQQGIRPLKIRVGIDFGNREEVIWSHYGIPGCSELTTTSLNTDMAAKLQSKAYDNTILIGGNVKERLDLKGDFWTYFETEDKKERVFNISHTFTYPFFVFDWKTYLLSFPFIVKNSETDLEIKEKNIWIDCHISDREESNREKYYPNLKAIPKNKQIHYTLMRGTSVFSRLPYEQLEWHVYNSGKEAEVEKLEFEYTDNKNKTSCQTNAAYLGHHYIQCKIIRPSSSNEYINFPIFVQ